MNCLRCELARAKALAILFWNLRKQPGDLVNRLNDTLTGSYFEVSNEHGSMIYRKSNVEGSPNVEIWFFGRS